MNRIGCISVNYRSAPVEIREKLFVNPQDFQCICARDAEIYALATCNRTEVYWTGIEERAVLERMEALSGIPGETLLKSCEIFRGEEAIKHLDAALLLRCADGAALLAAGTPVASAGQRPTAPAAAIPALLRLAPALLAPPAACIHLQVPPSKVGSCASPC